MRITLTTTLEQLTVRKDNDTKFDPDKMHNELAIDEKREGCCKIEICDVGPDDPPPDAPGSSGACPAHHWSQWGEWTQCDKRSASYPHSTLLVQSQVRARGQEEEVQEVSQHLHSGEE